jgi:hypothetical protein
MGEKKYVSKLRDKFKERASASGEGGRGLSFKSLSYDDDLYKDYKEVTLPESQKKKFNTSLKAAMKKRAEEVLSGGASSGKKALTDGAKEIHKGLTGIRHPAQLIPVAKGVNNLAGLIRALTKK